MSNWTVELVVDTEAESALEAVRSVDSMKNYWNYRVKGEDGKELMVNLELAITEEI